MNKKPAILAIVVGVLLLLAVGLQVWPVHGGKASPGKGKHLASVLPEVLVGVKSRALELGNTENVRTAVERTLQYDDVFYREYRVGEATVTVYAAYWGPARMPTQLVASHTPDRCWVENGWACEQSRHDVTSGITGDSFLPAEWRLFKAPVGPKLHVIFWHLVGDQVYDYGERLNRAPSVWRWWRDAASQIIKAPPEQYFIRVTSDIPFEKLQADPAWQDLLRALGQLGLDKSDRKSG
jgi:hypothetical protein